MHKLTLTVLGLACIPYCGQAQTNDPAGPDTGVIGSVAGMPREYTAQTSSERIRSYIMGTFGPVAVGSAILSGSISQAQGTPKEWGGGAEAFGERIGNSYARHVIRKTLEFGGATLLHEDNRYLPSMESGFGRRAFYAVRSTFIAHDYAGHEHPAYSRFAGALGGSFIATIWAPRSTSSSGDALVSFGISVATAAGFNVVKEFSRDLKRRKK
jgi:hypothetical protein